MHTSQDRHVVRWLTPFAWVDRNDGLHIDARRLCYWSGLPITDANIEVAVVTAREFFATMCPGVPIEENAGPGLPDIADMN